MPWIVPLFWSWEFTRVLLSIINFFFGFAHSLSLSGVTFWTKHTVVGFVSKMRNENNRRKNPKETVKIKDDFFHALSSHHPHATCEQQLVCEATNSLTGWKTTRVRNNFICNVMHRQWSTCCGLRAAWKVQFHYCEWGTSNGGLPCTRLCATLTTTASVRNTPR